MNIMLKIFLHFTATRQKTLSFNLKTIAAVRDHFQAVINHFNDFTLRKLSCCELIS